MEIELRNENIIYQREKNFNIPYEGIVLPHKFSADFFIFSPQIVAVMATSIIHPDSFGQTVNYLKAAQIKLGILLNFGADGLPFQRIVFTY
jgi:GxxExxY protein